MIIYDRVMGKAPEVGPLTLTLGFPLRNIGFDFYHYHLDHYLLGPLIRHSINDHAFLL